MGEDKNKAGYQVAADGHTYHKSATANAVIAPTNEATQLNATKTKGLSNAEAEFVTIIDYEWHLKGTFDPEGIKTEYGYKDKEFAKLCANAEVLRALQERGVTVKALSPDSEIAKASGRSKLTPIQLIVANSVLDLVDTRPIKKKLQDCQVTPYQYQSWLKDPHFKAYLHERSEGLLDDVKHEAMISLIDKVMAGDLPSIKYYNEMTGRFVSQTTASVGTGTTHNLEQMIIRIIEIINDEVTDLDTAIRIGDRLKGLVMGNQVINAINEAPVVPEIAAPREMTARAKDMMSKGVGVNE